MHLEDRQTRIASVLAVVMSAVLLVVMIRLAAEGGNGRLLGHYKYRVAPADSLVSVDRDGQVKLRKPAAQAFLRMKRDAARAGIDLVAISGFRGMGDQKRLFFSKAAERGETLGQRSMLCAPPGYSEHHTGYTLDVGDGRQPTHGGANLEVTFKDTLAYRWMRRNAARYHYELSFPESNNQGVSYEPWHWRYVGNLHSFRTFYKARSGVTYGSMFPVP